MSTPAPSVKAVFDHAAEIESPAEREAYLAEACAGRPDVRREVDELLRAYGDAASFLESGPVVAPAGGTTEAAGGATEVSGAAPAGSPAATIGEGATAAGVAPAAPTPGRIGRADEVIAGKYTLVEPIGEGGMGAVWRARQTEPVRRYVAVKLIKAGMDSRQVLARFEAERQALALMDHPNIARVLDGGLHDGRPFFVMELVKGVPITEYCDARRLTPKQRLELFVPVCQAIQHAHQKGVIHRDIKPSNVLIALYDDRPVPKVIDFGVAKATGPALTEHTIETAFGGVVGTPQYMSPEQATLNNLDIDTRSDVYALGVLLYELLTGSTPFSRRELERKGVLEILRVVREEEPPRPSTKLSTADALPSLSAARGTEPRALTGLLRSELDWVVMKALEKDRSRRYETANAFAADVRRYLEGEAVQAHPPGAGYRLGKFVRRNRGRVVAAALVLLALVAGVVGTSIGLVRATRAAASERAAKLRESERAEGERLAKQEALASAAEERRAKETVEAVLGFVEGRIFAAARPKGQEGGLGYDVKLADAVTAALPFIEKGFADRPLTEARLRRTIGQSFLYLGKPEIAAGQFEAARSLCIRHLGPDHPDTLKSMNNLANSYAALGRHAEALKLREETLALMKAKLGPDHPDTLAGMNSLAESYAALGRHAEALKLHEETLALMKAKLGPDHPDTLKGMHNLANSYSHLGRHADALKLFEETLALRKAKLGPDHPETLVSMGSLANSYTGLGRHADALKLNEETLALLKAKLGPDHPETLVSMGSLANSYDGLGRHAEALKLREETLALMKAKLGPGHPRTLYSMNGLAYSYDVLGRHAEAVKLNEETLALQRAGLGPDHPETLVTMNGLTYSYAGLGRHADALKLREETLALRKARLGPDHPDTLTTMNDLAISYLAAGRVREALALLEEGSHDKKGGAASSRTLASLQAWLGQDKEYGATRKRVLALAKGTDDAAEAGRAAQAGALRPSTDPAELEAVLALGRKAVELNRGQRELLALGMGEFRSGHFAAAAEALLAATKAGQDVNAAGIADFYRAMSLFQQGKKDEAREVATRAATRMEPLPRDEQNPLLDRGVPDHLILWLAYKEAKAMIGLADPPAAPAQPAGK